MRVLGLVFLLSHFVHISDPNYVRVNCATTRYDKDIFPKKEIGSTQQFRYKNVDHNHRRPNFPMTALCCSNMSEVFTRI